MSTTAQEKHFTVREVADLWSVSENTVRKMFRDMPEVLKIASPRISRRERKRAVPVSLRIPASALVRAHENWSRNLGAEVEPRRRGV